MINNPRVSTWNRKEENENPHTKKRSKQSKITGEDGKKNEKEKRKKKHASLFTKSTLVLQHNQAVQSSTFFGSAYLRDGKFIHFENDLVTFPFLFVGLFSHLLEKEKVVFKIFDGCSFRKRNVKTMVDSKISYGFRLTFLEKVMGGAGSEAPR